MQESNAQSVSCSMNMQKHGGDCSNTINQVKRVGYTVGRLLLFSLASLILIRERIRIELQNMLHHGVFRGKIGVLSGCTVHSR